MSALAECYATVSTPFAVRGPFYGPQGHRGADYRRGARQTILAYEHGVVVDVSWSKYIGWTVTARLDDGRFAGWAHVRLPVPAGRELHPGDRLADVAGAGDNPGTLWAGAHIHTTIGPRIDAVYQGAVYDPAPRIAAAIASSSTAADEITPIPETNGLILMPDISIVIDLPLSTPPKQIALGPRGEVALNGAQADYLNRWLQWQKNGGRVTDADGNIIAGGLGPEDRRILLEEVLSKIA
jgi:hypothetical protein